MSRVVLKPFSAPRERPITEPGQPTFEQQKIRVGLTLVLQQQKKPGTLQERQHPTTSQQQHYHGGNISLSLERALSQW
jgi:hypothetical protein